jgi:DNA-binding CsgD family transcriptional regulator
MKWFNRICSALRRQGFTNYEIAKILERQDLVSWK